MVFVFNETATTEIYSYGYTLSLHVALPSCTIGSRPARCRARRRLVEHTRLAATDAGVFARRRSDRAGAGGVARSFADAAAIEHHRRGHATARTSGGGRQHGG